MKQLIKKGLLPIVMISGLSLGANAQFSGAGTESNPYIISSGAELATLAKNVTELDSTYYGRFFKLTSDVTVSGEWLPIGSYERAIHQHAFMGTFDGNGHTVSGVQINNDSTSYAGLFGIVSQATIKNLTVAGANIKGFDYVGAVVGGAFKKSVIENVVVKSSNVEGARSVGGVVGTATDKSKVINSRSAANVKAEVNAGGIVGWLERSSSVLCCQNTGVVTATEINAGGVVGKMNNDAEVVGSANGGNVLKAENAGGVVGYADNSVVSKVVNGGCVISEKNNAGGVIGYARRTKLDDAVNGSLVEAKSGDIAGGITGYAADRSKINNAFNNNAVKASKSAGSVVGYKRSAKVKGVYYDKQMCNASATYGNKENKEGADTVGRVTSELVGNKLQPTYGDSAWSYRTGGYPAVQMECINDVAQVVSTPLVFNDGEASKASDVKSDATMEQRDGYRYTSNETAVYFTEDGTMRRIGMGTDTVKVLDKDGNIVRSFPINVTSFDGLRIINEDNFTAAAGSDTVLTQEKRLPKGKWSSTNESVATVDQNGAVNGLTAGTTDIYCTLANGTNDHRTITYVGEPKVDTPAQSSAAERAAFLADHLMAHYKFNNNSDPTMSETETRVYNELVQILKDNKDIKIMVVGHTCNIGSHAVNMRAGAKRAKTIFNKMVKDGVPASQISTDSRAYDEPLVPNDSAEHRRQNRRVEFEIVK